MKSPIIIVRLVKICVIRLLTVKNCFEGSDGPKKSMSCFECGTGESLDCYINQIRTERVNSIAYNLRHSMVGFAEP